VIGGTFRGVIGRAKNRFDHLLACGEKQLFGVECTGIL